MRIELKFLSGEKIVLQTPFVVFPKSNLKNLTQKECGEAVLPFKEGNWVLPSSIKFLKSAKIIR